MPLAFATTSATWMMLSHSSQKIRTHDKPRFPSSSRRTQVQFMAGVSLALCTITFYFGLIASTFGTRFVAVTLCATSATIYTLLVVYSYG